MLYYCSVILLTLLSSVWIIYVYNGRNRSEDEVFLIADTVCSRIYQGKTANIQDHPHLVYIETFDADGDIFVCGGSIISAEWILTAAHCLIGFSIDFIRAGSADSRSGGVVRRPLEYFPYETYDLEIKDGDIGLIRVSPFPIDNETIRTIRLPDDGEEPMCGKYTISGWGFNEIGYTQSILKEATLQLMDFDDCNNNYYDGGLTSNMICADADGPDTCQGDSGGPLVKDQTLVGIVSFGRGCGVNPGVYVKVSKFRNWIRKNTGV